MTYSLGIWTHIAASFDSQLGNAKIFVNGEKHVSDTNALKGDIKWGTGFVIGGYLSQNNAASAYLKGDMDEVCLFSGALDSMEVKALFEK